MISPVYFNQGFLRGRDASGGLINPANAMNAGVNLGATSSISAVISLFPQLNDISLKSRIRSELIQIKPSCDANIIKWAANAPDGKCYDLSSVKVGIIIHIVVASYPQPISMGAVNQFWSIFQGDIGFEPISTITKYLKKQNYYPPVPATADPQWMMLWYWNE